MNHPGDIYFLAIEALKRAPTYRHVLSITDGWPQDFKALVWNALNRGENGDFYARRLQLLRDAWNRTQYLTPDQVRDIAVDFAKSFNGVRYTQEEAVLGLVVDSRSVWGKYDNNKEQCGYE